VVDQSWQGLFRGAGDEFDVRKLAGSVALTVRVDVERIDLLAEFSKDRKTAGAVDPDLDCPLRLERR